MMIAIEIFDYGKIPERPMQLQWSKIPELCQLDLHLGTRIIM